MNRPWPELNYNSHLQIPDLVKPRLALDQSALRATAEVYAKLG